MESKKLTGIPALSYSGVEALTPPELIIKDFPPTSDDSQNFNLGTLWLVPSTDLNDPDNAQLWMLVKLLGFVATWIQLFPTTGGTGANLFPTDVGMATPAAGVVNIFGSVNINTAGAGNTVTVNLNNSITIPGSLTLSSLGAGVVQTTAGGVFFADNGTNGQILIGGGAAPSWQNITSTGATITITNGPNSINLEVPGAGALVFHTDLGDATPVAGAITFAGGSNIHTSGSGSTVTVDLNNSISVPGSVTAGTTITAGTGLKVSSFGAGVVQTSGAGVFSSTKGMDGQLLISSTAGVPAWANIIAGANISITNGPNTITITDTSAPPPPFANTCAFLAKYNKALSVFQGSAQFLGDTGNDLGLTIVYDLGGNFFAGGFGNPARFTAPATGKYLLNIFVTYETNVFTLQTTTLTLEMITTARTYNKIIHREIDASGAPDTLEQEGFEALIDMTVGDTAIFLVNLQSTPNPISYRIAGSAGTQLKTWISGFRVA